MVDLAGRGPLGQNPEKQPAKPRKPIPKQSRKRAAYMRSAARVEGVAHMLAVKALPCICCGHPAPSEAHHVTGDGKPRDDMRVIPLCYACHRGPEGYHNAKRSWVARYGRDCDMLDRVAEMLEKQRPHPAE